MKLISALSVRSRYFGRRWLWRRLFSARTDRIL